jgi:hypothetical protein
VTALRTAVTLTLLVAAACGGGGGGDGGADVPQAAELVGSYDLTTTRDRRAAAGVARVAVGADTSLELSDPPVALHGTPRDDGTMAVTGFTTHSDDVATLSGTASVERHDGVLRIAGSLDDGSAFVADRPAGFDQSPTSGTYRFHFIGRVGNPDAEGTVDVELRVDADGRTSLRTGGAPWLTADMILAPSRRFRLRYDSVFTCAFGRCRVDAVGVLPSAAGDPATAGTYSYLFYFLPVMTSGDVEFTRLAARP